MIGRQAFRQSMMKWNLFLSACIFAVGLLLKLGAPPVAVGIGVAFAALVNWSGRRRDSSVSSTIGKTTSVSPSSAVRRA